MSAASGPIKSQAALYVSPALINWHSKPSVNFVHAVDLCYEVCAAHNSAIVHIVTLIIGSTYEPFSAIFAVVWYCLNDFLIYASAFLRQT